jgi:hypothetical protein
MPLVHGLNPRKTWVYAIGSPGCWGGAAPANAGAQEALPARGQCRGGPHADLGHVGARCFGGEVTDGGDGRGGLGSGEIRGSETQCAAIGARG